MPLFAGKRPTGNCFDQVKMMKSQGFPNDQIIQSLQKDGYSSADIVDALNKADQMSQGMSPNPPMDFSSNMPNDPYGGGYPQQPMQPQQMMPQNQIQPQSSGYDLNSAEELIEAIIDEKWNELIKDINKIIEWKNKTENKITALEQQFNDLKNNFDKVHQAIIGKISEYDKNILEVGTEIKAMEKVFSKVLPVFTDNVNELSRITEKVKKKK